jgi:hypothetical protein
MNPRLKRALPALGGLLLVAMVVVGMLNIVDHQRTLREVRALQGRIYQARVAADSCRNTLAYQEDRFRAFDRRIDSLRARVRAFESLDERGVPEEQYQEYLRHFDAYNDSVATWRARADSLRSTETACRSLVAAHNLLTDSLRERLEAEGTEVR